MEGEIHFLDLKLNRVLLIKQVYLYFLFPTGNCRNYASKNLTCRKKFVPLY